MACGSACPVPAGGGSCLGSQLDVCAASRARAADAVGLFRFLRLDVCAASRARAGNVCAASRARAADAVGLSLFSRLDVCAAGRARAADAVVVGGVAGGGGVAAGKSYRVTVIGDGCPGWASPAQPLMQNCQVRGDAAEAACLRRPFSAEMSVKNAGNGQRTYY